MKPQALLVTLAIVAVLAALPLAESQGTAPTQPLCCNDCGVCNRKFPPECFCNDASFRGCHPACKNCEKFTNSKGDTIFQCQDMKTNFCQRRC
ncbi:hypothetical protein EJB05_18446, partial [Eragrostis curvula]